MLTLKTGLNPFNSKRLSADDVENLLALGYTQAEINSAKGGFPPKPPKKPSVLFKKIQSEAELQKKNNTILPAKISANEKLILHNSFDKSFSASNKKVNEVVKTVSNPVSNINKSSSTNQKTTKQTFQTTSIQDVPKQKPMEKLNEFISNPVQAAKDNIAIVAGVAIAIVGAAVYYFKFHKTKKR